MSPSFPLDHLARMRDGARRMAARASAHERQLEALIATAESDVRQMLSALSALPEVTQASVDRYATALQSQVQRSSEGMTLGRQLCVGAREQHMAAIRLLSDLGELRHDKPRAADAAIRHAVLVVDDYQDSREVVAMALHNAGFIVRTASNGLEAVIAAYELQPAVIVMDVMMPVLDGIEATRLIKAIDSLRDARVIAHTARPTLNRELVDELFAAVLHKPTAPDLVVATVQQLATA